MPRDAGGRAAADDAVPRHVTVCVQSEIDGAGLSTAVARNIWLRCAMPNFAQARVRCLASPAHHDTVIDRQHCCQQATRAHDRGQALGAIQVHSLIQYQVDGRFALIMAPACSSCSAQSAPTTAAPLPRPAARSQGAAPRHGWPGHSEKQRTAPAGAPPPQ